MPGLCLGPLTFVAPICSNADAAVWLSLFWSMNLCAVPSRPMAMLVLFRCLEWRPQPIVQLATSNRIELSTAGGVYAVTTSADTGIDWLALPPMLTPTVIVLPDAAAGGAQRPPAERVPHRAAVGGERLRPEDPVLHDAASGGDGLADAAHPAHPEEALLADARAVPPPSAAAAAHEAPEATRPSRLEPTVWLTPPSSSPSWCPSLRSSPARPPTVAPATDQCFSGFPSVGIKVRPNAAASAAACYSAAEYWA
ncbi:unnamed protein product [Prorocentrum cordatum]|uniref:Subtilisin n=1 Tax=Prorocentrum cordatum TaxID=2364126 RepID=A0ABN9YG15_9DINO|nr:unnamed protein product [Polarella glacialis]